MVDIVDNPRMSHKGTSHSGTYNKANTMSMAMKARTRKIATSPGEGPERPGKESNSPRTNRNPVYPCPENKVSHPNDTVDTLSPKKIAPPPIETAKSRKNSDPV